MYSCAALAGSVHVSYGSAPASGLFLSWPPIVPMTVKPSCAFEQRVLRQSATCAKWADGDGRSASGRICCLPMHWVYAALQTFRCMTDGCQNCWTQSRPVMGSP
jgi:hypothetical protein